MSGQLAIRSEKMSAGRKRLSGSDRAAESSLPLAKKRAITTKTVEKWQKEHDKELNMATWLRYETIDRDHVLCLSCCVCKQFEEKLTSMRNYNPAYIVGSKNLRASSFKDHASSEMHSRTMLLLKKAQSTDVCEYAPIAKALHVMDSASQQAVKKQFDVAFVIAKEYMAMTKMKVICELE